MSLFLTLTWHAFLGGMCAYRARGWLEARREWLGLPFLLALAPTALMGMPSSVFTFRFHTAYFFHYLGNPASDGGFDTLSFGWSLLLMLAMGGALTGGFLAVRYAADKMHAPYCLAPAAAAAVLGALFVLIFYRRVFWVGDLADFTAATGIPLHRHLCGVATLFTLLSGSVVIRQEARWFKDDRPSQPPARTSAPPA